MRYQVTGNEYISLPTIRESDGGIEGITFLHMHAKGMLEMRGSPYLIRPYLMINKEELTLTPEWTREYCWLPRFSSYCKGVRYECTYLTPLGQRGFALHLEVKNETDLDVSCTIGLEGTWASTLHEINEKNILEGRRHCNPSSGWNHMFIFSQHVGLPLFAFAPITEDYQPFSEISQNVSWTQRDFSYDIYRELVLLPGLTETLDVFFGIGYDEVAAATAAKELLRLSCNRLICETKKWLSNCYRPQQDRHNEILVNTNLFFSYFFASGRTIDTEELCMVTSRSPRYYVSAAYWDRDSLLWAFPAILEVDIVYARELLIDYVFKKQKRNFGVHSRFIDGTVLEPGFELDELCAPVIALARYIDKTKDDSVLSICDVQDGLFQILMKLESKKNANIDLYETFLQPTDDMHLYPYLTYNNALVCEVFRYLGQWNNRPDLVERANLTKKAIYTHCVKEKNNQLFFAWSVDLHGNWDIYDEPPGSLQLLPFYGFCDVDDPIWINTMAIIRSDSYEYSFADHSIAEIGCKHAPHPWVLSICNSLLSGHDESALLHLSRTNLDNGVACESVNEETGKCETGEAFATCAGFLAFSLIKVLPKYPIEAP